MKDFPDFHPTASGVELIPMWAARYAFDKSFYGSSASLGAGLTLTVEYTVPAGKVLYITQFSVAGRAVDVANADKNLLVLGSIYNVTDTVVLGIIGGNGGAQIDYSKALVIAANHLVYIQLTNSSSYAIICGVNAGGYEI